MAASPSAILRPCHPGPGRRPVQAGTGRVKAPATPALLPLRRRIRICTGTDRPTPGYLWRDQAGQQTKLAREGVLMGHDQHADRSGTEPPRSDFRAALNRMLVRAGLNTRAKIGELAQQLADACTRQQQPTVQPYERGQG